MNYIERIAQRINERLEYIDVNPHKVRLSDMLLFWNLLFISKVVRYDSSYHYTSIILSIIMFPIAVPTLLFISLLLILAGIPNIFSKCRELVLDPHMICHLHPNILREINFEGVENLTIKSVIIDSLLIEGRPVLPDGLKELYIHNNNLKTLEGLPQGLTRLILSCNILVKINQNDLPDNLTYLDLSNNELTMMDSFCLPRSLIYLDVSNNKLKRLPRLPLGLKTLIYDNNKLPARYGCHKTIAYVGRVVEAELFYDGIKIMRGLKWIFNICKFQRLWKNYWYNPYLDPKYSYPVSRYMLKYRGAINANPDINPHRY